MNITLFVPETITNKHLSSIENYAFFLFALVPVSRVPEDIISISFAFLFKSVLRLKKQVSKY
jgi:hypothetical protein